LTDFTHASTTFGTSPKSAADGPEHAQIEPTLKGVPVAVEVAAEVAALDAPLEAPAGGAELVVLDELDPQAASPTTASRAKSPVSVVLRFTTTYSFWLI
jgi:hypothetical protein